VSPLSKYRDALNSKPGTTKRKGKNRKEKNREKEEKI
jgi:hypothetical protein